MNARTRDEIRAVIFDALASIAPEADPAGIDPEQSLRQQIDLDSYDFLNIIIQLSETLQIDIGESDYREFATLNRAIDYLARRTATGAGV
jgi:acyl carrier protein